MANTTIINTVEGNTDIVVPASSNTGRRKLQLFRNQTPATTAAKAKEAIAGQTLLDGEVIIARYNEGRDGVLGVKSLNGNIVYFDSAALGGALQEVSGGTGITVGQKTTENKQTISLNITGSTSEGKITITDKTDSTTIAEITGLTAGNVTYNNAGATVTSASTTTQGAIEALEDAIDALSDNSVVGSGAISASTDTAGKTTVSLSIKDGEKILSQSGDSLSSTLTIAIEKKTEEGGAKKDYIVLKGINGAEVASVDASTFVKDGMIDSVAFSTETGKENILVITWNTDAGKTATEIDLSKYIDAYTAGDGLTTAGGNDHKFQANVDGNGIIIDSATKKIALSLTGATEEGKIKLSGATGEIATIAINGNDVTYTQTGSTGYTSGSTNVSSAIKALDDKLSEIDAESVAVEGGNGIGVASATTDGKTTFTVSAKTGDGIEIVGSKIELAELTGAVDGDNLKVSAGTKEVLSVDISADKIAYDKTNDKVITAATDTKAAIKELDTAVKGSQDAKLSGATVEGSNSKATITFKSANDATLAEVGVASTDANLDVAVTGATGVTLDIKSVGANATDGTGTATGDTTATDPLTQKSYVDNEIAKAKKTAAVKVASDKSTVTGAETVGFKKHDTGKDTEKYYVNMTVGEGNDAKVYNIELDAEDFIKDGVVDQSMVKYGKNLAATSKSAQGSATRTTGDDTYIEIRVKDPKDPEAEQTYTYLYVNMSEVIGDLAGGDGISLANDVITIDLASQTDNKYVQLALTGTTEGQKQLNVTVNTADVKEGDTALTPKSSQFSGATDNLATTENVAKVANTLQDEINAINGKQNSGSTAITVTTGSTGDTIALKLDDTTAEDDTIADKPAGQYVGNASNALAITADGLYLSNVWDCGEF